MGFFETGTLAVAAYFVFANGVFLILLIISFFSLRRDSRSRLMVKSLKDRYDLIAPPVSIIAPAFNEAKSIEESVQSFLRLDYPAFDVLVVNDGSTDDTFERLQAAFDLFETERFYDDRLSRSKIKGLYASRKFSNLFVINKERGGKADAINMGIGFSRHELFCAVDSDCILEPDCLLRVVIPFIEEPKLTIGAGGTVRPINGCLVHAGRLTQIRFPKRFLAMIQVVEYLRAFLFGRQGWNVLNSTLIISGAFGIFRKDIVMRAGGYRKDCIGEDMELVVRLRRFAVENQLDYRISFVPDPICWTEVPETLSGLSRQRDRWQRGLAESLLSHKTMFLNPRYGLTGFLAYPYFLFVELIGPAVEIGAYVFIFTGLALGFIDPHLLLLVLAVDIGFGIFMSLGAVFIEESTFHKYSKIHQLLTLVGLAVIEHLGYRQLMTLFRLKGFVNYLRGHHAWGTVERSGFDQRS
jgi:cellulose synthase/poly-beta-1,6-N-acetylglucosamine synthase-like glycosyltransferase